MEGQIWLYDIDMDDEFGRFIVDTWRLNNINLGYEWRGLHREEDGRYSAKMVKRS